MFRSSNTNATASILMVAVSAVWEKAYSHSWLLARCLPRDACGSVIARAEYGRRGKRMGD